MEVFVKIGNAEGESIPVAMPLLLDEEYIGGARVVAARIRPKLIGGERATYRK